MTPKERRQIIDEYIIDEQKQVDKKYEQLIAGTITVAAFFDFMRRKIAEWHSVAGVAAYQKMNGVRWQRVGDRIQSELAYLKDFQIQASKSAASTEAIAAMVEHIAGKNPDIPAGLETVVRDYVEKALRLTNPSSAKVDISTAVETAIADSVEAPAEIAATVAADTVERTSAEIEDLIWGEIGSRGRMYTDAAYGTYENSIKSGADDAGAIGVRRVCAEDEASCDDCVAAASDEYVSMAEVIDIGDTACMSNCRCYFEFDYEGVEPLTIDRSIYA